MSLKDLKKNRNRVFQKYLDEISKIKDSGDRKTDDRFWYPAKDKIGNAMAIIRFLPAPDGEEFPWIRLYSHSFKNNIGQWLIENCPTTLNKKCPVCEANSILWNTQLKENQEVVRTRKRKVNYISNIYIISDPANQDNEGKVFLFKYGKKLFDKINEAMFPEFKDEKALNPFDFWSGANFKLKVRQVEGYTNYDKSEFSSSSPLFDDDDEIERIWNQEFSLLEFVKEENFKSYEEIKAKLHDVLLGSGEEAEESTIIQAEKPVTRRELSLAEDEIPENFGKKSSVVEKEGLKSSEKKSQKKVVKEEIVEEEVKDDSVMQKDKFVEEIGPINTSSTSKYITKRMILAADEDDDDDDENIMEYLKSLSEDED